MKKPIKIKLTEKDIEQIISNLLDDSKEFNFSIFGQLYTIVFSENYQHKKVRENINKILQCIGV